MNGSLGSCNSGGGSHHVLQNPTPPSQAWQQRLSTIDSADLRVRLDAISTSNNSAAELPPTLHEAGQFQEGLLC